MSKHTPGPFEIVNRILMEDGSVYPIHIVDCQNQHQICMMESPLLAEKAFYRDDLDNNLRDARIMANARLLASAPELLDALQNLLAVMNGDGGTRANAQEIARQAIAKAEGEQ